MSGSEMRDVRCKIENFGISSIFADRAHQPGSRGEFAKLDDFREWIYIFSTLLSKIGRGSDPRLLMNVLNQGDERRGPSASACTKLVWDGAKSKFPKILILDGFDWQT